MTKARPPGSDEIRKKFTPTQESSVSYAELKVKEITYYGIGLMGNQIICNALDGDRQEKLSQIPFGVRKSLMA
jgi:hypothetical protein